MNKYHKDKLVLENYENEFLYKKKKSNLDITFNRIAFIFFLFLFVSIIYSVKVFYLSSLNYEIKKDKFTINKKNFRADIIDNNGNFIVKTINTIRVGINPNLIIDKKRLLINLQLIFPQKSFNEIKEKMNEKNFFIWKKE